MSKFVHKNPDDKSIYASMVCVVAELVVMKTDVCSLKPDKGPCTNYVTKWYYDTGDKLCKTFTYGGCGGNGNLFTSQDECTKQCGTSFV